MKTAACYIRVSTEDQTELSPGSQLKLLQDYAKVHDMLLPNEFIFIDEGISGRTAAKRRAFNRMIGTAKCKPKPFDCILLWKFSRFARNREDSIIYKSMLRKQLGIEVISISENLGDDKMAVLIEAMIEAMDEYYSINLAEEVRRGMKEKASRGGVVTAPSFGYKIIDKNYVPNPETAPLVQMIFESFCSGAGCREIAQKLNAMGIPTKRGGLWENRTIEYLLNNPVYIGQIRWNSSGKTHRNFDDQNIMLTDGHHQPIISDELWEKAQQRLTEIKSIYRRNARTQPTDNGDWMLRSVLHCSNCGGSITRATGNSVQCYKYAHGKCNVSHHISMNKMETCVLAALEGIATGITSPVFTLQTHKSNDNTPLLIAAEKRKLERVKAAYEAGVDTLEEYSVNKKKILCNISYLEEQKENIPPVQKPDTKKSKSALQDLTDPDIPASKKNAIMRTMVHRIIFQRSNSSAYIFLS